MSVLEPNHFLLNNAGNTVTIEYWSAQKKLTVTSAPNPVQTFTGAEITDSKTPIGRLISVSTPIDPETESILSFLLPAISLQSGNQTAAFQTLSITDRHTDPNSQSVGPVHDNYTEAALSGTGNIV
jgi:hypothetical protein